MHLKQKPECMLRCAYLYPPMTIDEVRRAEQPSVAAKKKVRKGAWKDYTPPCHVALAYGPKLPTSQERRDTSEDPDEDICLTDLRPSYTPPASVISWLTEYLGEASKEGPRPTAASFWCQRPSFTVL